MHLRMLGNGILSFSWGLGEFVSLEVLGNAGFWKEWRNLPFSRPLKVGRQSGLEISDAKNAATCCPRGAAHSQQLELPPGGTLCAGGCSEATGLGVLCMANPTEGMLSPWGLGGEGGVGGERCQQVANKPGTITGPSGRESWKSFRVTLFYNQGN